MFLFAAALLSLTIGRLHLAKDIPAIIDWPLALTSLMGALSVWYYLLTS